MIDAAAKRALTLARDIQASANEVARPPSEVTAPYDQPVLPHSLFEDTRGYIEKIVYQINRTYEHTCYDACAVMIRRLVEVLIIEAFEEHKLGDKIKDPHGNYVHLDDLINATLSELSWTLGRNTKTGLPKLKTMGDQSAHGRRYNARRQYVDEVIVVLRTASEELLYLADLR